MHSTVTRVIHHVQIACPAESDETVREYYLGVLGLAEVPQPPALAVPGGCWFAVYGIEWHVGVEVDFRPGRKAHPGLLWPDPDGLALRLSDAGYPVRWASEEELPGMRRLHTEDPHGKPTGVPRPA